jgi:PIN domain nuclease of toxin-antitoxin system
MRVLLDTCEFLWYVSGDASLSLKTKQEIQNPNNDVFLSVVSLWEIVVKHNLGKLPLPQKPEIYVPAQRELHRVQALSLEESSVKRLSSLPEIHRDPFDRMLVCQALEHGCTWPPVTRLCGNIRFCCFRVS